MSDTTLPVRTPFDGAFGTHYRELVRFLAHRTGNPDDARDLAHDTWLRLAESAAEDRPPPVQARAYLFAVAHHLAIDHLRRARRADRWQAEADGAVPANAPDAAEALMYRQAIEAVDAALQQLPDRTREVFLQHRLHGVGQAALAERYGLSRNTIERDVMRAMDELQAALERWHAAPAAAPAPSRRRRSMAALLLGGTGLVAGGWAGWRSWLSTAGDAATPVLALATPRGRQLRQALPDGSALVLDADSTLDFVTARGERRATLRGAAYFDVVHDPRPFVVRTALASLHVLGTRFGVEASDERLQVQVDAGRVRIEPDGRPFGAAPIELGAGEELRLVRAGPGDAAVRIERRRAGAGGVAPWRDGRLVFDAVPLGDVLQRLVRYRAPGDPGPGATPAAAALPVSGQLRIVEAEDWIRALPSVLPVRLRRAGDGWQIERR